MKAIIEATCVVLTALPLVLGWQTGKPPAGSATDATKKKNDGGQASVE